MDTISKRAICVMVIGKKYQKQFSYVKPQFEAYAKKCSATLHIIDTIPDPTFHRPLLAQKLLIPHLTQQYDLVLFLDLDILISENAPDVFNELNGNIPDTYPELIKIKGIGDYTASAIGSIAFNLPVPVVDGNVNRVIARLFGNWKKFFRFPT